MRKAYSLLASALIAVSALWSSNTSAQCGGICADNCISVTLTDTFGDGWNGNTYVILDAGNNVVATGTLDNGSGPQLNEHCVPDGCYTFQVSDFGPLSFPGEIGWTLAGIDGGPISATAPNGAPVDVDFGAGGAVCVVFGCTNANALNFDPLADTDDGSCVVPTCALPATNFSFCYGNNANIIYNFSSISPDSPTIEVLSGITEAGFDTFNVYDGPNVFSPVLFSGDGDLTGLLFTATGQDLTIQLISDASVNCSDGFFGIPPISIDYYCSVAVIPGCTDAAATNYDPAATIDDGTCVYPPANSFCADAVAVQCGDILLGQTTTNAIDDQGLIGSICGTDVEGPGVWYVFNGTGDELTASTCNPNSFDTRISIYEGTCGSLTCLGGADDTPGCPNFTTTTFVTTTAGVDYYIYVHGFGGGTGDFDIEFTCDTPCLPSPANDDCVNAQLQFSGFPFTGSLCCANTEAEGNPCQFAATYGVWFTFDSEDIFGGGLTWETINFNLTNISNQGVGMTVWISADGTCNTLTALACCPQVTGTCAGALSDLGIAIVPNSTYYYNVWTTFPDACGEFSFSATGEFLGCTDVAANNYDAAATLDDGSCTYTLAPANDLCANAQALICGQTFTGSTGASTLTGASFACGVADAGVWYTFVGNGQLVTVSLCGSVIDANLQIYTGSCGSFVCFANSAGSEAECGFFDQEDPEISFISTNGTTYTFYVSNDGVAEGLHDISVTCAPVTQGCTEANAANYNPAANVDDGSCTYTFANSCGNSYSICYDNFDSQAYTYTGTGPGQVMCVNFTNANIEAGWDVINVFDGPNVASPLIFSGDGVLDGLSFCAASGTLTIQIISDGSASCADGFADINGAFGAEFNISCEFPIPGCTNPDASNYDPSANIDDGSCQFCGQTLNICYGNSANDVLVLCADPGEEVQINILSGAIEQIFDFLTVYDGPNILSPVLFSGNGNVGGNTFVSTSGCLTIQIISDTSVSCESGNFASLVLEVLCGQAGCDVPIACNYNANALFPDCNLCDFSSCLGCTYTDANNYNALALIDDGSCIFPISDCPQDIAPIGNPDGIINTADLLALLAVFGTTC